MVSLFQKQPYIDASDVTSFITMIDKAQPGAQASEESVKQLFESVLGMTISDLHDVRKHTFPLTPYMIAMVYVHRFLRFREYFPNKSSSPRVQFSNAKCNMDRVSESLKTTQLSAGPLTGIVYIADNDVSRRGWVEKLKEHGAFPIGREPSSPQNSDKENGGLFFVANKLAVFSMSDGIHPRIKEIAEYYQLYTVSLLAFSNHTFTITTRTFSDLLSVANALCADKFEKKGKPAVTIVLGYSDFGTDEVLYKLGMKLPEEGYYADFYFHKDRFEYPDIDNIMSSRARWQEKLKDYFHRRSEKFGADTSMKHSKTSAPWSFILSSRDCVIHGYESETTIQPVHITIPLDKNERRTSTGVEQHNKSEGTLEIPEQKPGDELTANSRSELNGTSGGKETQIVGQETEAQEGPSPSNSKHMSENGKKSEIEYKRRSQIPHTNKIDPVNIPKSLSDRRSRSNSNQTSRSMKPERKTENNAISEAVDQLEKPIVGQETKVQEGPSTSKNNDMSQNGKKSEIENKRRSQIPHTNKINPVNIPKSLPDRRSKNNSNQNSSSMKPEKKSGIESKRRSQIPHTNTIHPVNIPKSLPNRRSRSYSNQNSSSVKPETKSGDNAMSEAVDQLGRMTMGVPKRNMGRHSTGQRLMNERASMPVQPVKNEPAEKTSENNGKNTLTCQKSQLKPGPARPGNPLPVHKKRSIQIVRRNNEKRELVPFAELIMRLLDTIE